MKYKDAGVNIGKADKIIDLIKNLLTLSQPKTAKNIGSFAGKFELGKLHKAGTFLYASVDGVGTKTKLAAATKSYEIVGYDIVAHCVNDVMMQGAIPLFFMDYIAMGKLSAPVIESLFKGMLQCSKECNTAILGGETAEMPGIYHDNDFDIVGFILGLGNKKNSLPKTVKPGDVIVGINSSGLHTNGYSLVRKIIEMNNLKLNTYYDSLSGLLGNALMQPHLCYYKIMHTLIKQNLLRAAAHITGGGIEGNLVRVLPENTQAIVKKNAWNIPPIFNFIQQQGGIKENEMYKTFNMGIGLILVIEEKHVKNCIEIVKKNHYSSILIGNIVKGERNVIYEQRNKK